VKRNAIEECIAAIKQAVETPQHSTSGKSDIRMAFLLRDQPRMEISLLYLEAN